MGLAAPRKKAKISHDPNNTSWARSTSGYGLRILSSHGWTPGDFLGARNAAHATMYTAASASRIKTALKDDTLGLGARQRRDLLNEPTGLDAFKGLLGRLNGKPDAQLEEEERSREEARLAQYAATKWQTVRFISGGLLTQEKIESVFTKPASSAELHDLSATNEHKVNDGESAEQSAADMQAVVSRPAKERSSKRLRTEQSSEEYPKSKGKKEKKHKERKRNKESNSSAAADELRAGQDETENGYLQSALPVSTVAKEYRPIGRHIIRGRYMDAKKKALLDDKLLSEIFMVKS